MATEMEPLEDLLKQLSPQSQREVLAELISKLPPELHAMIRSVIESLAEKGRKPNGHLRQDWAGALEKYREQFTSLELQRKSLDWRGD